MIIPVLLSGGIGIRLWPLSTPESPKQFLRLFGGESLLQAAARRVMGMEEVAAPVIVTGASMRRQVIEHLGEMGCAPAAVLTEPAGRNTAPAAMAAALWAETDDLLLGLPTDHLVTDVEGFQASIRRAVPAAQQGRPVIFGIPPSRPHPGLGYMEVAPGSDGGVLDVRGFVEKPDIDTAVRMVESGNFLWNGGMFLVQAGVMRELISRLLPGVAKAVTRAFSTAGRRSDGTLQLGPEFETAPSVSVAKGLWERADRVRAVKMEAGWSDIGSWAALGEVMEPDGRGNLISGPAVVEGAQDVQVFSQDVKTAILGVSGVVVVVANDRVLVATRDTWEQSGGTIERLEDLF